MVQHQLTVGQMMMRRGKLYSPSWDGRHRIAALGTDWALMVIGLRVILCRISGREELNPYIGARFKSGTVTICGDARHTWAEIQDFRFVQTEITGSRGVWYVHKWVRENLLPEYEEQINESPLYGASFKRCKIKGGPIDITEQCV